jgi:hypothetical protein
MGTAIGLERREIFSYTFATGTLSAADIATPLPSDPQTASVDMPEWTGFARAAG